MTMVLSRGPSTTRLEQPVSVSNTIGDTDPDEWNRVREPHTDPFMDPGFVAAVEDLVGKTCRFRPLLLPDEQGPAVAAACLCYFPVDAAVLANGFARRLANVINGVAPFLLRVPLLLVG